MALCPSLAWGGRGGREFPRTRHGDTSGSYIDQIKRLRLWKERLDVTLGKILLWKTDDEEEFGSVQTQQLLTANVAKRRPRRTRRKASFGPSAALATGLQCPEPGDC